MSDWYDPDFSFRRPLLIMPMDQPIKAGYPVTVMVDEAVWKESNKLRDDDADIRVVYMDPVKAATPVQIAIPHKVVHPESEEHEEMLHVIFNTETDLMEMSTPSINSDYYLYYGNKGLHNYVELPFEESDFVIRLTPNDYNFSLTFSRPTEDWLGGASDTINARFTLSFYGIYAKLTMKKGPDKGIMEVQLDDYKPTYVDTYNSTEIDEAVFITTSALTVGDHIIRCRVTGDKNPTSEDYTLEFVSWEYSIFVEAMELEEEINPTNSSLNFLTGV